MIDFFILIGKLISVVPVIVTVCSFVAAITPTPVDDGLMKKVYMIMDWCALNVWKAKDKQVNTQLEFSSSVNEWGTLHFNYGSTQKKIKKEGSKKIT